MKCIDLSKLEPFDKETGDLNAIIETPQGRRNKLKYDDQTGLFKLSGVLPAGMSFPYDFGFVPATSGEDGDPLDILILMDEPVGEGCLVAARLIGVIEAEQTEDGKTERNDRLIAVATESHNHRDVKTLGDLNDNLLKEIEGFFISYNAIRGKDFKPTGRFGPTRARQLVRAGMQRFEGKKR